MSSRRFPQVEWKPYSVRAELPERYASSRTRPGERLDRRRFFLELAEAPLAAALSWLSISNTSGPDSNGGEDDSSNLALACPDCNACKGPNLTSVDPESGRVVALFNPRRDTWSDHFSFDGPMIVARTPRGWATVRLLSMNEPSRVEMRLRLQEAGAM